MAKYDAMTTFQTNVESLLEQRGWSKQDLADRLGMDRSQLSKVIRGQNAATIRTLERIASEFGLTLYDLFRPSEKLETISG